jgi:hypothetical protein
MELYCPRCLGTYFASTGYSRCAFWPLGLSPRLPSLVGHLLGTYSPAIRFAFTHPRFISRPGATSFRRTVDWNSCAGLRVSWRFALARSLARSLLFLFFLSPLSLVSCVRGFVFCFLFPFCLRRLGLWKPRLYLIWLCTCCYCSVFHWVRVVGVVVLTFLWSAGRPFASPFPSSASFGCCR